MIDLRFNQVSKRYRIPRESGVAETGHPILRKLRALRPRPQDFWAVRDVSFEVPRGEALGIIGHNGAGKSTILKLLSNITVPSSGEIMINGRLSALIEVGSGFHPELTGRENIYLNGSILGMRRREIADKLDSIVEFAGIHQFIDTPVKRYSSGMYVRLGFSIAAHLDPDILLLDEVLAVGDAGFQAKCIQRINELKRAGTTIVFISHDLDAVEKLCDRVLLMQQGMLLAAGSAHEVLAQYQDTATKFVVSAPPGHNSASLLRQVVINSLTFFDAAGHETSAFRTGEPLTARLDYEAHEAVADIVFEVFFYGQDGSLHSQLTTAPDGRRINLQPGAGTVEFVCPGLGLQPGTYVIDATIDNHDWQYQCATIRVAAGEAPLRGAFYLPHEWQLIKRHDATDGAPAEQVLNEYASHT
ncbi:MAG: ABC transporter ATP-binding protein [Pyrinomonadaceae bacterium]